MGGVCNIYCSMKRFIWIFLLLFRCDFLVSQCVLVVGGAGFIGSHVNEKLYRSGYETIVLDNLSSGSRKAVLHGAFIQGDIADRALLEKIFSTYKIDAVMHFAAYLQVGESVTQPLKYYQNNVAATLNLLEVMLKHNVKIFIFSSSAAIFGIPKEKYVKEDHPCHPINPYGQTKLMVETILADLDPACGLRYTALRYFNAAGGDPEGLIKNEGTSQQNLIPIVLRSIRQKGTVTIFGTDYPTPDGTGVRDYIHVDDLASAHIKAMERLFKGSGSACYNLGSGRGYSVREVITAAEKVTGHHVSVLEGPRRAGDPPHLLADSEKAYRELGWKPQYPQLEKIISDAWRAL